MPVNKIFRTSRHIPMLALLLGSLLPASLQAQLVLPPELPQEALTLPLDEDVPLTPEVLSGELANGLRYFIRENDNPSNRADIRLIVDTGSVMEDANQLGLAHFLEHMAFNGTENFQKHQIIEFMESIGMRFGAEVNASTSFDETSYKLQVPSNQEGTMETALDILRDWATGLTLDPVEIDKERGVVIEEWRLNQGAGMRVTEQLLNNVVKGSRYAERLPIGTLESLQTFSPADLRRFYEDWYRPDLMAVIAVGDFDREQMEAMIQERFSDIPAATNARVRTNFQVPVQSRTEYMIVTDTEIPIAQVSLYHKKQAVYDWTAGGYRQYLVESLYNSMMSERLQERSREPDSPFLQAGSSKSNLVRALTAYQLAAAVQETAIEAGLQALLTEAERAVRYGFTVQQLDRQKTNLARALQQYYDNRNSRASESMVEELTRAFLTGESVPGEPMERALTLRFLDSITLDEVNAVGRDWMQDPDRLVVVVAPDKAGLDIPTETDLDAVIASVAELDIQPVEENLSDEPLLAEIPEGSPVVVETGLGMGITEWTLANGVKVVIKPTDFSDDQVLFTAFSPGGTSLAGDADFVTADNTIAIIAGGGIGQFNAIELQRKLTGKVANVMPFIADYEEGFNGSASPADLDTLLQLIYLRMTNPRADITYYQVLRNQIGTVLQNRDLDPSTVYGDTVTRALFDNHPRRQPPTTALLDQMDLDKAFDFYRDRLGDATDFTFVFVGNFTEEQLRPLVETYLGSLPVSGKDENWKDVGIRLADGVTEATVTRGLEPQSRTTFVFTGEFDADDRRERLLLTAASQIVQSRLLEVMREELGGTYGVSVNPQVNELPVESYSINLSFASSPDRVDEMYDAMLENIRRLQVTGPTASEVSDKRLALLKQFETQLEENGYWLRRISDAYRNDEPVTESIEAFARDVEGITQQELHRVIQDYFNEENYVRVTLMPENAAG